LRQKRAIAACLSSHFGSAIQQRVFALAGCATDPTQADAVLDASYFNKSQAANSDEGLSGGTSVRVDYHFRCALRSHENSGHRCPMSCRMPFPTTHKSTKFIRPLFRELRR